MGKIKSPCRKVCKLNEDRICIGCGRTADEITQWVWLSAKERQQKTIESRQRLLQLQMQGLEK